MLNIQIKMVLMIFIFFLNNNIINFGIYCYKLLPFYSLHIYIFFFYRVREKILVKQNDLPFQILKKEAVICLKRLIIFILLIKNILSIDIYMKIYSYLVFITNI